MDNAARKKTRDRVRRYRRIQQELRNEMRRQGEPTVPFSDNNEHIEENCHDFPIAVKFHREIESESEDTAAREDISFQPHAMEHDYETSDASFIAESDDNDNADAANQQNDDMPPQQDLREEDEIRKWALECNIPQSHLDKLLNILRARLLPQLPKSSKTFLQTNSMHYDIVEIRDNDEEPAGTYVYFGVGKGLKTCVNSEFHPERMIDLQINVDGLPLFASSKIQFWPILCRVFSKEFPDVYKPFIVAIYCGETKPHNVNEFLTPFVEEINELSRDGIIISETNFEVRIQCFICDTPARSFMKQTKGHGGYSSCERCTVRGTRVQRRTVYPEIDEPIRTDDTFRRMQDQDHHNGVSALIGIIPPINMVTAFVLDFMHLCCIGVMKRLLVQNWLNGNLRVKLGRRSKTILSQRLEDLSDQLPAEFQRKPRKLEFAALWKATEYRFLLLYLGPIVFKKVLSRDIYKHFLLLHVACRILCTEDLAVRFNQLAKLYLRRFFEILRRLYGAHTQVLNMHNVIHIADDVQNMQCALTNISAFPFESFLGKLKKLVRAPNRPLVQVCRRLHEHDFFPAEKAKLMNKIEILKAARVPVNGIVEIYKLKYINFVLTTKSPNDTVVLNDKKILKITEMFVAINAPEDIKIKGMVWKSKRPIFTYPTPSDKLLGMWELDKTCSSITVTRSVNCIEKKCMRLSLTMNLEGGKQIFAIPLLHC